MFQSRVSDSVAGCSKENERQSNKPHAQAAASQRERPAAVSIYVCICVCSSDRLGMQPSGANGKSGENGRPLAKRTDKICSCRSRLRVMGMQLDFGVCNSVGRVRRHMGIAQLL